MYVIIWLCAELTPYTIHMVHIHINANHVIDLCIRYRSNTMLNEIIDTLIKTVCTSKVEKKLCFFRRNVKYVIRILNIHTINHGKCGTCDT